MLSVEYSSTFSSAIKNDLNPLSQTRFEQKTQSRKWTSSFPNADTWEFLSSISIFDIFSKYTVLMTYKLTWLTKANVIVLERSETDVL